MEHAFNRCETCHFDFSSLATEYDSGSGGNFVPLTLCQVCSRLLCPACETFPCDDCGQSVCVEHMVSLPHPQDDEMFLHVCSACADRSRQLELPFAVPPARERPRQGTERLLAELRRVDLSLDLQAASLGREVVSQPRRPKAA